MFICVDYVFNGYDCIKTALYFFYRAKDLLQNVDPEKLNTFRKQSIAIKDLQLAWNKKMQDLGKKGYDAREVLNARKDSAKIKDLEFLKSSGGPFTRKENYRLKIT